MAQNSPPSSQRSGKNPGVSIPIQVRVGGAFMALAAVLFLLALVAVFTDGWGTPFAWTPIRVAIIIAADRKSTRLNSSHVAISYAVFCLKKKSILSYEDTVITT